MNDKEVVLIGALRDLLRAVEAHLELKRGFKGMGHNIMVESAGRMNVDAIRARRLLKEYDETAL